MKVFDVIFAADENTMICIHTNMFGMDFRVESFGEDIINNAEHDLLDCSVGDLYVENEMLHIVPKL